MRRTFRTSAATRHESYKGQHRFEHWYRDNTVYFITARCRDRFPAFDAEEAKHIFWDRFYHWTEAFGFIPWIVTLLNNHYHVLGYLAVGDNLGSLMQRLHGSVAKLVNDTLPVRHLPFWRRAGNQDYFDGCIRDVLQLRRAYHYTLMHSGPRGARAKSARVSAHARSRRRGERGGACDGTERVSRGGSIRALRPGAKSSATTRSGRT
jgi:REP element-mobilizing transposase RayT